MSNFKTLSYLVLMLLFFSSCTIYYTTSQVDDSLKKAVDAANNSVHELGSGINDVKLKYKQMHCEIKSSAMQQTDLMLLEIENDFVQINTIKDEILQEYSQFQNYTSGKKNIESGTPEFKKMRRTHKVMNAKMKDIQKRGDELVKKVDACVSQISKGVFAPFREVEVVSYKSELEKSLKELDNSQGRIEGQILDYESKINQFNLLYAASKPKNCEGLKADMEKIYATVKKIQEVRTILQNTYDVFNIKTQGLVTVNSCSANWPIIIEAEASMQNAQGKINAIQLEIQSIANHIQLLVK